MGTTLGNKKFPLMTNSLKKYIYEIKLDVVFSNNTVTNLNSFIKGIKMYYLYETTFFPILQVDLTLDYTTHTKICEDIDKCKFRLNQNLIDYKDFDQDTKKSNGISESILKNLNLIPNDYDKTNYRTDFSEMVDGEITMTLELFLKNHLQLTRRQMSNVYSSTQIKNILLDLLNYSNQNILFNKPDNKNKIKQLICPSKNLVKTIQYIQETYGIYKTGLRLFFDYTRGYCMPGDYKYGEAMVEKGEYQNTIIYIAKNSDEFGCYFDNNKKVYYILGPNSNTFQNNENSVKEMYGEDIQIKSQSQNNKKVNVDKKKNKFSTENSKKDGVTNLSTSKVKKYYNKFNNEFTAEATLAEATKKELQFVCTLKDIDLRFITPNKSIYIYFLDADNKEYNGEYQIANMTIDYNYIAPKLYETQLTIVFNRLNNTFLKST